MSAAAPRGPTTVTYDELQRDYAPRDEDTERLIGWLQHEGYTDVHRSADRTGVYATATVSQIEKSLDVNMARVTKGGLTYTAATNAPSLPLSVGDKVSTIAGLQPFRRAQKHFHMRLPQRHNRLSREPRLRHGHRPGRPQRARADRSAHPMIDQPRITERGSGSATGSCRRHR